MNAYESSPPVAEMPSDMRMHRCREDISVIIPVYRNSDTLSELHRRLTQVLTEKNSGYEIIFVNDACPTGSLPILRRLVQNDHRVAVVSLAHNVGQHMAVLIGLAHARNEWSVIMDADLQDPPEAIPTLIDAASSEAPIVFAARRGKYESYLRLLTSRCFKWLLHVYAGVPADAGIFMVLHRDVVDRIQQMCASHPFVQAMVACTGFPMISIPVVRAKRPVGSSAYSSLGRLKSGIRGVACSITCKYLPGKRPFLDRLPAGTVSERIGQRFTSMETLVSAPQCFQLASRHRTGF